MNTPPPVPARPIQSIARPDPKLLVYYTLVCLPVMLFPPAGLLVWGVNYCRYRTMRYRFDDQGVSMRWGLLFRREVLLNYSRIQDIHLVSNFVERHLGLARIQVQTASGSATPEMTIEGIPEFEAVRDFLYARMRGTAEATAPAVATPAPSGDLAPVLREIAAELRAVSEALQRGGRP